MFSRVGPIPILLVFVFHPSLALERPLEDINDIVRAAVAGREPEWQIEHVSASLQTLIHRWAPRAGVSVRSSRGRPEGVVPSAAVVVQVMSYPSAERAASELRKGIARTSILPNRTEEGLGNDAFVWDSYGPHGESAVRIRDGDTLVFVSGPTLDITLRFAKTYLEEMEKLAAAPVASKRPPVEPELILLMGKAFSVKEPDWLLENEMNSGNHIIRLWKLRPDSKTSAAAAQEAKLLSLQLFQFDSVEKASEELEESIFAASVSGSSFEGLGDEGYAWMNDDGRGPTSLRIRRGNSLIWVSGPSLEVARRFVQHTLDAMVEHEKAVETSRKQQ